MKEKNKDRFYDFVASLMFLFDVDWDQELPNGIGRRPEIKLVKGSRSGEGSAPGAAI